MGKISLCKNPIMKAIIEGIGDDDPHEINCGDCDDFAEEIASKVPGAEVLRLVEVLFPDLDPDEMEEEYPSHWLIEYKGRYYDAEVPIGVKSIKKLPIMIRHKEFMKLRKKD